MYHSASLPPQLYQAGGEGHVVGISFGQCRKCNDENSIRTVLYTRDSNHRSSTRGDDEKQNRIE